MMALAVLVWSCDELRQLSFTDHITSPSALVFPIETLIELCKKHNVMTLIDGAHAPGQIKLNLRDLQADFYVGEWLP